MTSIRTLPSKERLNALLDYDYVSGSLRWKGRSLNEFSDENGRANNGCSVWNSRFAGAVAGMKCYRKNGSPQQLSVKLGNEVYGAHRLIWTMVHGDIPRGKYIDHQNRNPFDNRMENLRLASHTENVRNAKIRRDNKTGFKGVNVNRDGEIVARITVDNRRIFLGKFHTVGMAAGAYLKASMKYHKEFASHRLV